jgi:Na+-transporting NADH:ubiquinone oxidoreductase subunit NqrA
VQPSVLKSSGIVREVFDWLKPGVDKMAATQSDISKYLILINISVIRRNY